MKPSEGTGIYNPGFDFVSKRLDALGEVTDGEAEVASVAGDDAVGGDPEGDGSGDNAKTSTGLVNHSLLRELANHQEHESQGQEEEEGSETGVGAEGTQAIN